MQIPVKRICNIYIYIYIYIYNYIYCTGSKPIIYMTIVVFDYINIVIIEYFS